MNPHILELLIKTSISKAIYRAEAHLDMELPRPGYAIAVGEHAGSMQADFNMIGQLVQCKFHVNWMLADTDTEAYIVTIIPHEIAHLVTFVNTGFHALEVEGYHGETWMKVMKDVFDLVGSPYYNASRAYWAKVKAVRDGMAAARERIHAEV